MTFKDLRLWLVSLLAVGGLVLAGACGDDDGSGDDDDDDDDMVDAGPPMDGGMSLNPACTAAIAAKEDAVSGMLPASFADATQMVRTDGDQSLEADYAGRYRDDLANHPGCAPRDSYDNNSEALIADNEATVPAGSPAAIPGYPCAAKVYDQDSEDTSKPIVILVHGNSSGVLSWEEYAVAARAGTDIVPSGTTTPPMLTVDATTRPMLASRLLDEGYAVIAFDARVDLVATLGDFDPEFATGNPFFNIDHGWAVPMLQALIKAVMTENPERMVSLVGHSLGVTVTRDALRRLFIESRDGVEGAVNPFAQLKDVVMLSGANHGVATFQTNCGVFQHMRGTVTCEMGDRSSFTPTFFTTPNNGPSDLFGAPCADGSYAYGETDQCGGNVVQYTTVTMQDIADGMLQDEFVSEDSSSLDLEPCVANELIGLEDYDTSAFFITILPALLPNHFGSARSDAGMDLILDKLGD